jgi:hypothetical protein
VDSTTPPEPGLIEPEAVDQPVYHAEFFDPEGLSIGSIRTENKLLLRHLEGTWVPADESTISRQITSSNTDHKHQLGFEHFTLVSKPDRRSRRVGFVEHNTSGGDRTIGTVFYDTVDQKYWGTVFETEGTPPRENPQQVLADIVRLYLLGPLGESHPTVTAAYGVARSRLHDRDSAIDRVPEGKNPNQQKRVIKTEAAYETALSMLASVLAAAGYDVLGYGDMPSPERAEEHLRRWIEALEQKAPRRG